MKIEISLEALQKNNLDEKQLEYYLRNIVKVDNMESDIIKCYCDDVIEVDLLRYTTIQGEKLLVS